MRLLVLTLLAAVAAIVAIVALVAVFQERGVWQPPARGAAGLPPPEVARRVAYAAADGQPLHGYLVGPAGAGARVLIAFHGNAEVAHDRLGWASAVVARTGWSVFLPEYRGYAGLPGAPTYAGSQADARAAHAVVRDSLGVPPARIAIHGFSLGTAVATELAHEVGPSVLVLEAPFTSARDMARAGVLLPARLLWRWIARVHFDTRARVAELDAPVWVIHGRDDMIIPVRMGRAVHAAARVRGEYVEVPRAGHNDLAATGGERYWRWLAAALADAGTGP